MKWQRMGRQGRIDDRRGAGSGGTGMSGFPIPISGKLSLPVLLLVGIAYFFLNGGLGGGGVDVNAPLDQFPGDTRAAPAGQDSVPDAPPADEGGQFVAQVSRDIEEMWQQEFAASGRRYDAVGPATSLDQADENPGTVVFSGQTQTGCGAGSSATGPFYCPLDERVYIDLTFYDELARRFGAPGDFAQAYVLAHEIGHHVQHLLGVDEQVRRLAQQDPGQRNDLSVRQELQADCFAGVWAHTVYERRLLEAGDIDEGLTAAAAIGDDRIQEQTTGRINPESWTHGSSEQRATWLRRGYESGDPQQCDTFSGDI